MRREKVSFTDKTIPTITQKREAYLYGDWFLAVPISGNWYMYTVHNGKRLKDFAFTHLGELEKFIEYYTQNFGEFFPIWTEYPDANIHRLAQWTVKNGVDIVKVLESQPSMKNLIDYLMGKDE